MLKALFVCGFLIPTNQKLCWIQRD